MKKNRAVKLEIAAENQVKGLHDALFRAVIIPGNPVTTCEIRQQYEPIIDEPGFWTLLSYGVSVCKPEDTYDEETGLRLALLSALRKIENKELRKAFWSIYLGLYPPQSRVKPERTIYHRGWDYSWPTYVGVDFSELTRGLSRLKVSRSDNAGGLRHE